MTRDLEIRPAVGAEQRDEPRQAAARDRERPLDVAPAAGRRAPHGHRDAADRRLALPQVPGDPRVVAAVLEQPAPVRLAHARRRDRDERRRVERDAVVGGRVGPRLALAVPAVQPPAPALAVRQRRHRRSRPAPSAARRGRSGRAPSAGPGSSTSNAIAPARARREREREHDLLRRAALQQPPGAPAGDARDAHAAAASHPFAPLPHSRTHTRSSGARARVRRDPPASRAPASRSRRRCPEVERVRGRRRVRLARGGGARQEREREREHGAARRPHRTTRGVPAAAPGTPARRAPEAQHAGLSTRCGDDDRARSSAGRRSPRSAPDSRAERAARPGVRIPSSRRAALRARLTESDVRVSTCSRATASRPSGRGHPQADGEQRRRQPRPGGRRDPVPRATSPPAAVCTIPQRRTSTRSMPRERRGEPDPARGEQRVRVRRDRRQRPLRARPGRHAQPHAAGRPRSRPRRPPAMPPQHPCPWPVPTRHAVLRRAAIAGVPVAATAPPAFDHLVAAAEPGAQEAPVAERREGVGAVRPRRGARVCGACSGATTAIRSRRLAREPSAPARAARSPA